MSKFKKKYCNASFFMAIAVLVLTIILSFRNPDAVFATGIDSSDITNDIEDVTTMDTTDEDLADSATDSTDGLHIIYNNDNGSISTPIRMLLVLTVLSLAPSILIMFTSFTRIIIVLHFIRTAIGTQTSPPNQVIVGLALFLTMFIMWPTFTSVYDNAIKPLDEGTITQEEALEAAEEPFREFMYGQTQTKDLALFVDMSGEIATITGLMRTCLLIGGISFLAFLGLSFVLARWAVRPVEVAWNQQRQFVADASHELKTPLTVILTNAELLRVPGRGPEEQKRLSESILTMSHQMRGLVESLLELARVDNGTAKLSFSELDLSTLVEEGLLPFEPVYFEKELQLESRGAPGLRVRGSESHLQQVLDILLDNAAKYCTPGGAVKVELKRQGSHCVLSVSNPGEEISREDLKNIFKRFYRIDKARTGNHSYGLGLSIAESIVQGHGGKIWAESKAGVNTFFVSLNGM